MRKDDKRFPAYRAPTHRFGQLVTDPEGRKAAQELNKIAIDPQDVARAVVYALNQPENVTVNDVIISPTRENW
ncbi:MAG: hypothetical protein RR907_01050 [Comamonas sp.]